MQTPQEKSVAQSKQRMARTDAASDRGNGQRVVAERSQRAGPGGCTVRKVLQHTVNEGMNTSTQTTG
jgi:hypothetical protein